jgi:hypothetical protein
MPSHYWYHCENCQYRAYRYRNVKFCPDCGSNLIREEGGHPPLRGMVYTNEMRTTARAQGQSRSDA